MKKALASGDKRIMSQKSTELEESEDIEDVQEEQTSSTKDTKGDEFLDKMIKNMSKTFQKNQFLS